jgi:hypothetical protein
MTRAEVPAHLTRIGQRLLDGLQVLASRYESVIRGVAGIPEMCHLEFRDEPVSGQFATACAERGLIFKRGAYNFVSLAHDDWIVDRSLAIMDKALSTVARST